MSYLAGNYGIGTSNVSSVVGASLQVDEYSHRPAGGARCQPNSTIAPTELCALMFKKLKEMLSGPPTQVDWDRVIEGLRKDFRKHQERAFEVGKLIDKAEAKRRVAPLA